MKKTLLTAAASFGFTMQAHALTDTGLSPSSLKLSVYKFAVSTSPLCTNLQTIINNPAPTEVNFIGGVNLGGGHIDSGTYPCVAIEFDSLIHFTPSSNSLHNHCTSGVEEALDVCPSGGASHLIDGTEAACVDGHDHVTMYLSTASTGGGSADPFHPPTSIGDTTNGFPLTGALTVGGTASARFVVNPASKVCDTFSTSCDGDSGAQVSVGRAACHLEPPSFAFTAQ